MGMVLSFVPRPAPVNRAVQNTGTPAAVIIFPGVRYEQPPVAGETRPAGPDKPPTPVPHH